MNEPVPSPTKSSSTDNPPVSYAVVRGVADAAGVSPLDLQPLATVVDPDALDRLVESMSAHPGSDRGSVAFSYEGYDLTVHADGHVDVTVEN